ncbi:hypothetical protein SLEP1_g21255 [Rubroshorea leprosula]|uniref:Secreted protein n=1 Tax=Rubroshorea leprosula TaxID=152421 RepID=A0AAV5JCU3_9ROSI|nr:hypothetical protein SLEP1_g21255 [Rubroshorea leprosula]
MQLTKVEGPNLAFNLLSFLLFFFFSFCFPPSHFCVSAHFLLPCTEQAFSQAQPPSPTPLEKLICCLLPLLPPVATGVNFGFPVPLQDPASLLCRQLQFLCLLNFLVVRPNAWGAQGSDELDG